MRVRMIARMGGSLSLLFVLALPGCHSATGPGGAWAIQVSGNAQSGVEHKALPQQILAKVVDEHGAEVALPLWVVITSGNGRISMPNGISGSGNGTGSLSATPGEARVTWVLGDAGVPQVIWFHAVSSNGDTIRASATATSLPS